MEDDRIAHLIISREFQYETIDRRLIITNGFDCKPFHEKAHELRNKTTTGNTETFLAKTQMMNGFYLQNLSG